tara:strand:+ start:6221 stop:6844 length:624 start_codon:yes stop_codon:yes gene_type:complete
LIDYAGINEEDTVVTLGDYVDRGPDTKGVIDTILELRERTRVVSLMGNHEIMMLEARDSGVALARWMGEGVGGSSTVASYGGDSLQSIPVQHWEFIEGGLPFHESERHLFVHANAASHLALEDQDPFMLFWEKFRKVPPHRSGKTMVCGHTAQKGGVPANLGHAICIDTWAYGGQWLTALDVQSGTYWQCNEVGEERSDNVSRHLSA